MSRESGIGGGVLAMAGKKCLAMASDKRYGWSYQMTTDTFHKIFQINNKCLFGASGLYTDIQTVFEKSRYNANMYRLREGKEINGRQFANSTAHLLYSNRFASFQIGSMACGLDENDDPVICSYDGIGAPEFSNVGVCGRCSSELMGMADTFYRDNMEPEELVNTIGQCFLAACGRNAFSGFGLEIFLLIKDELKILNYRPQQD